MAEDKNAFLTNIRPEIQETLNARQDDSIRNQSTWFKDRTPWARLSSLVRVGENSDAEEFRKQYVLFMGTSAIGENSMVIKKRFKDVYNNEYLRPFAGLTKVHVQNKNSYGSVREAVISFNCWTLEQLDIFEKLYMSLGMPLLLEWGWSTDLKGVAVSENLSLIDPTKITFYCIDKKIKKSVNKWKGHFDAMIGLVTDFNWSLTQDGGFECSTTIISPGDMYLSMGTRTNSKGMKKLDDSTKPVSSENLDAAIFNLVKRFNSMAKKARPQDGEIRRMR